MKYGFYVGHSKESIKEARKAILKILSAPHADEKTKQLALESLAKVLGPISNIAISNCTATSNPKKDD